MIKFLTLLLNIHRKIFDFGGKLIQLNASYFTPRKQNIRVDKALYNKLCHTWCPSRCSIVTQGSLKWCPSRFSPDFPFPVPGFSVPIPILNSNSNSPKTHFQSFLANSISNLRSDFGNNPIQMKNSIHLRKFHFLYLTLHFFPICIFHFFHFFYLTKCIFEKKLKFICLMVYIFDK